MPTPPLLHSNFSLDVSGVAGFFGGDEAVSAMGTVHVYEGRRWLGWYNSPGSYEIAKRYGQLACSRFWNGLYPGGSKDPATLFELDGKHGPRFAAARSGTIIKETGHIAHLLTQECKKMPAEKLASPRTSSPVPVTVVDLWHTPDPDMHPSRLKSCSAMLASIPIIASVGTCFVCAFFHDWICCMMILFGMLSSGLSCFVIGSGQLTFTRPKSAGAAPVGDGILEADNSIIVLKGSEGAVAAITRGSYGLHFDCAPEFRRIGLCSLLLMTQFFVQLLLIPQGTLFGQFMFLSSLAVSAVYQLFLSSLNKEEIQRKILMKSVLKRPAVQKYELGTRTAMAVFVLLVLQPEDLGRQLWALIPNDTAVWREWKRVVVEKIERQEKLVFDDADWNVEGLSLKDQELLRIFFIDAEGAYKGYLRHTNGPTSNVCEDAYSYKLDV